LTPKGPHHPRIQRLRRLARDRSARDEEQAFLIEGPVLVREAVRAEWPLEAVFVGDGVDLDVPGVKTVEVASGVLERVATTVTPRPVVAVGRQRLVAVEDLQEATFLVVLDSISDPGNLGTIIRAAESAGVDGVVVGGGVDVFNPKCVRATAGALFFTRLAVVPHAAGALAVIGEWGMRRLGTSASAPQAYDEADLTAPVALVLGSEAHGLGDDVVSSVDHMVSIPIAGRSESLNVASAAAVLCFEVARQRRAS
jgi:RNA methyltransferase, TrmH family